MIGDSIALSYLPAIRAALIPHGYKVYGLALPECAAAFVDEDTFGGNETNTACTRQHEYFPRIAAEIHPGLVVMASAPFTLGVVHGLRPGTTADNAYEAGLIRTQQIFAGARIVNLSSPPDVPSLTQCASSNEGPAACVGQPSSQWFDMQEINVAVARKLHTTYVDTRPWTCSANGYCPGFIDGRPVFWDGSHLTDAYAETLAPEMYDVLTSNR